MFNVNSHANKFFDELEEQSEQNSLDREFILSQIDEFYKKTPPKDREKFIKQLSLVFHTDKKTYRATRYPILSRFIGEDDAYQVYINNIKEDGFLEASFIRNFVSLALKYNNTSHLKFILKTIYHLHFKTSLPNQSKEKLDYLIDILIKHPDLQHLSSGTITLTMYISYYLFSILLGLNLALLIAPPILIIATPILFILTIGSAIVSLFSNDKNTTYEDSDTDEDEEKEEKEKKVSIKEVIFGTFLIALGLTAASIIVTPVLLPVLIIANLTLFLIKPFHLIKDFLENMSHKIFLFTKNSLENMFQKPHKINLLEAPPKTSVPTISETKPLHSPSITFPRKSCQKSIDKTSPVKSTDETSFEKTYHG